MDGSDLIGIDERRGWILLSPIDDTAVTWVERGEPDKR